MKDYKKSFVIFNLLLIGAVLFVMNTAIMVYSYRTGVEELKTVMQQRIEPFNTIRNILRRQPQGGTPPEGGNSPEDGTPLEGGNSPGDAAPPDGANPPGHSTGTKARRRSDKYLRTVSVFFYNIDEDSVSVISKDELKSDDALLDTARKIYAARENFGTLGAENLYYFKQSTPTELKIAVASRNFIRLSMLELFAVLAAIFVLSMLVFYFISRKLADRAAKPLEDAMAREKQFITDASHDLKTPLTVILSNMDILGRGQSGEEERWIDATKRAAEGMRRLIEQMLVLAESEAKTEIKPERVDISDIAEQNALVMETVAYEKNIEYKTDIEPGLLIMGNADYTRRIVASLIDNAIKYEGSGGSIRIRLKKGKKSVRFSVANRLGVISREDISHIFERFYRADKSRHTDGGHGLGLAIVKNLTELMGGRIGVTSTPEDGTCFTVEFPAK